MSSARAEFVVYGEPASKSNSRQLTWRFHNGRKVPRFIKSTKALGYVAMAQQQMPLMSPLMTGDLRATIHIWYASRRPDLDESVILDAMQGRIYVNDRQVKERHVFHHLDKENPRASVVVEQV